MPSRTFCASSRSAADRVLQSRSALSSRNASAVSRTRPSLERISLAGVARSTPCRVAAARAEAASPRPSPHIAYAARSASVAQAHPPWCPRRSKHVRSLALPVVKGVASSGCLPALLRSTRRCPAGVLPPWPTTLTRPRARFGEGPPPPAPPLSGPPAPRLCPSPSFVSPASSGAGPLSASPSSSRSILEKLPCESGCPDRVSCELASPAPSTSMLEKLSCESGSSIRKSCELASSSGSPASGPWGSELAPCPDSSPPPPPPPPSPASGSEPSPRSAACRARLAGWSLPSPAPAGGRSPPPR